MYTDRKTQVSALQQAMYHASKCRRLIEKCKISETTNTVSEKARREYTIEDFRTIDEPIPHHVKADIVVRVVNNPGKNDNRFETIHDISNICNCSDDFIKSLISKGRISTIEIDKFTYIDRRPDDDSSFVDNIISLNEAKKISGYTTIYVSREAIKSKRYVLRIGSRTFYERSFAEELRARRDRMDANKSKREPKIYKQIREDEARKKAKL